MATTSTNPTTPEPWLELIAAADISVEYGQHNRLTSVEYVLPPDAKAHPDIEVLFFSTQCVCGAPVDLGHASQIASADTRQFTQKL